MPLKRTVLWCAVTFIAPILTYTLLDALLLVWNASSRGESDIAARGVVLVSYALPVLALFGVIAAALAAGGVARSLALPAWRAALLVAGAATFVVAAVLYIPPFADVVGAARAPLYQLGGYLPALAVDVALLVALLLSARTFASGIRPRSA